MGIATVMKIDAIRVVAPASDDLDVFHRNIAAAKAGDIVDQRITDGDALNHDVTGIDKMDCVFAAAVPDIDRSISEFVDFEEDLFHIFAVIENTAPEDSDTIHPIAMDAAIDNSSLIDVDSFISFQAEDADVVDTCAKIVGPLCFLRDGVVPGWVDKNMKRIVGAIEFD